MDRAIWMIIGMFAAAMIMGIVMGKATAHSFYDPYCCDDKDCKPISQKLIKYTDKGIVILKHDRLKSDHLIPYGDSRIRPSQDSQFHMCVFEAGYYPRCLYVPAGV